MRLQKTVRSILFRDYWEFDIINSHFAFANALTCGRFPALRFLVEQRAQCFRQFPGFRAGCPDTIRGIKAFFVALFNAPSPEIGLWAWRFKHMTLAKQFLWTPFIRAVRSEIRDIHDTLQSLFPNIVAKARLDGVSPTSRILFHCEDACLSILGECAKSMDAEVGGFLMTTTPYLFGGLPFHPQVLGIL